MASASASLSGALLQCSAVEDAGESSLHHTLLLPNCSINRVMRRCVAAFKFSNIRPVALVGRFARIQLAVRHPAPRSRPLATLGSAGASDAAEGQQGRAVSEINDKHIMPGEWRYCCRIPCAGPGTVQPRASEHDSQREHQTTGDEVDAVL